MRTWSLLAVFLLMGVSAQLADSPWPTFHGNAQHTGQSEYDTSHVDGTILWKFYTGNGMEASPVIGEDDTIYVATHGSKLFAINPDGTKKWEFQAGEPEYNEEWNITKGILSTPAIDKNGVIYISSFANKLFAVYPNGTQKWTFDMPVSVDAWSSPVIDKNGVIHIGSARGYRTGGVLYSVYPDGTEKKAITTGSDIASNPAIGPDGTIYIGTYSGDGREEGRVRAIKPNGGEKWRFTFHNWVESSAAVDDNNNVYIGSFIGKVFAINSNGTEKWAFQTKDGVSSTPAIANDGTIYVGSWDYYLYAINPDGTQKWKFETPPAFEGITSSPAIGADGTIYVGTNGGYFYAIYPNGAKKWEFYSLGGGIVSSPAIGRDGTVYAAGWDRYLYAFGGSAWKGPEEIVKNELVSEEPTTTNDTQIVNETKESEVTKEPEVLIEEQKGFFSRIFSWFKGLFSKPEVPVIHEATNITKTENKTELENKTKEPIEETVPLTILAGGKVKIPFEVKIPTDIPDSETVYLWLYEGGNEPTSFPMNKIGNRTWVTNLLVLLNNELEYKYGKGSGEVIKSEQFTPITTLIRKITITENMTRVNDLVLDWE